MYSSTSATLSIYVNGALVSSASVAGHAPATGTGDSLSIGSNVGAGSTQYLKGSVDDVRIYNRALSATEVKNLYNANYAGDLIFNSDERVMQYCDGNNWVAAGKPLAAQNGLVGWWKLDDGSGSTAIDSSGNGNTGTLTNSPTWVGGYAGSGALEFNGTNQETNISSISSISNTFTVSFWLNSTSATNAQVWQMGPYVSCEYLYQLDVIGCSDDNENTVVVSTTHIDDGSWHLVTYDVTATNESLYIDGELQASKTSTPAGLPRNSCFGGGGCWGGVYFKGFLDDVRVYNRALSASEVSDLYYATGGTAGDTTSGLVGWWKLDDGSGTTAADSSGDGNTGTLGGSPLPTWTNGKLDGALSFNGSQTVGVPDNAALDLSGPWTVSGWIELSAMPASGYLGPVLKKSNGAAFNYLLAYNNGAYFAGTGWVILYYDASNHLQSTSYGTTAVLNQWYFLAGVWDGTTLSLYLNGGLVGSSTPSASPNGSSGGGLTIAAGVSNSLTGMLDDVRIYNRALSATDVAALYNERACTSPAGWAADIRYDADSGVNAMMYCNGKDWQAMGPELSGAGGGGCSNPSGAEGDVKYYGDLHAMVYCDGTHWVRVGRIPAAPETGLAGWWKLDDGSSGTTPTTAADSSGNGNTGTLTNGPTWTSSGKVGNALTLNGSNQRVEAGDTASLRIAGSWTIAQWVKLSALPSSGNYAAILSKAQSGSQCTNYGMYVNNGSFMGSGTGWVVDFDYTSSTVEAYYPATISAGTWYYLTGVYDSSAANLYLYLNGILVATQATGGNVPLSGSGHPLTIGADACDASHNLAGTVDDARVYNRALSASEVWDLYLATGGT